MDLLSLSARDLANIGEEFGLLFGPQVGRPFAWRVPQTYRYVVIEWRLRMPALYRMRLGEMPPDGPETWGHEGEFIIEDGEFSPAEVVRRLLGWALLRGFGAEVADAH